MNTFWSCFLDNLKLLFVTLLGMAVLIGFLLLILVLLIGGYYIFAILAIIAAFLSLVTAISLAEWIL